MVKYDYEGMLKGGMSVEDIVKQVSKDIAHAEACVKAEQKKSVEREKVLSAFTTYLVSLDCEEKVVDTYVKAFDIMLDDLEKFEAAMQKKKEEPVPTKRTDDEKLQAFLKAIFN